MLTPNLLPQKEGILLLCSAHWCDLHQEGEERDEGMVVKVNDGRWIGCGKMLSVFEKAVDIKEKVCKWKIKGFQKSTRRENHIIVHFWGFFLFKLFFYMWWCEMTCSVLWDHHLSLYISKNAPYYFKLKQLLNCPWQK